MEHHRGRSVSASVPAPADSPEVQIVEADSPPPPGSQGQGAQGQDSTTGTPGGTTGDDEVTSSILDCPVCLQPSVHPVELPCGHIFCFLCIKGVATQGGQQPRCAICRSYIPTYVLTNPTLKDISQLYKEDKNCSGYKWFYESRSGGWWEYEERTMQELERAFETQQQSCQLLIAGHMYDINFTQMVQSRVGNPNLFRRIKRDTATADKRGIAGIRLVQGMPPPQVPLPHQQQASQGGRRGRRSPRGGASAFGGSGSARTAGAGASSNAQHSVSSSSTPQNDLPSNPITSPVSSQQSYDSDEDSDVFVDSDDDEDEVEDENDDMELGEEEEQESDETDEEEEELRDGARAPTSRSDRSTSSFNNQTPPPLSSSAGGAYSARGRGSKCGNRSTPPTSASTPSSASTSNSDHAVSPVSPTLRASPHVRSPLPSIVTHTSAGNPSNLSTSIQIGPGLRITVDYTNPSGEEEIL